MSRLLAALFTLSVASILFVRCADDCEPNLVDPDEIIYLNILRSDGKSIIKYSGNALPTDSVRVTNIANGASVTRFLLKDSLLTIDSYDKTNNATTTYKIEVGAPGVRKPDTLQIVVNQATIVDNCGRDINRARFKSLKVNTTTRCTDCPYNQIYVIQK